ncbi:MAG: isocitrate/isopropylmalate dehydrogenase family protein, partial [Longimicrobiales bacterium]
MSTKVTLIPGDGIGPGITDATVRVLEAAGADVEWERRVAGLSAMETSSSHSPLPDDTLASIRATRIALKGPLTTPVGVGFRSINVALRKEFDLYANVRPAKTLMHGGRYEDIDLVLIRENTEGLYVGVEHYIGMGDDPHAAAESVMIITRFGSERIIRYAFEYAVRNGRRKVTLAHKANILKYTQGLFLDIGREVAQEYAGRIEFEDRIIDVTAMQLVLDPYQFDVLVMENMFGDILSDQMAGLVGGLGMAPGGNIGRNAAMFEPVHGSAPDLAGKGVANPTAMVLAGCMMLDHIDEKPVATRIREALLA